MTTTSETTEGLQYALLLLRQDRWQSERQHHRGSLAVAEATANDSVCGACRYWHLPVEHLRADACDGEFDDIAWAEDTLSSEGPRYDVFDGPALTSLGRASAPRGTAGAGRGEAGGRLARGLARVRAAGPARGAVSDVADYYVDTPGAGRAPPSGFGQRWPGTPGAGRRSRERAGWAAAASARAGQEKISTHPGAGAARTGQDRAHLRREKSWCCLLGRHHRASEYDSASARRNLPTALPDCRSLDQEKKS